MTTESVCAKLMWILGQTQNPQKIKQMFYTPVANDILAVQKYNSEKEPSSHAGSI